MTNFMRDFKNHINHELSITEKIVTTLGFLVVCIGSVAFMIWTVGIILLLSFY